MNQSQSILLSIVVACVGASLLLFALGASTSLSRVATFWTDHDQLADVADTVLEIGVDSLVESGVHSQGLDPADPLLEVRKIVISEGINESVALRVVESLLYLDALDPSSPIDLYLHTPGGWADSAFAIADTIRSLSAPVNTIAIGGCYSAGAVILVAGTGTRSATESSILSVHANLDHSDARYDYDRYNEARMEAHFRRYASLPEDWYPLSGEPEQYYVDPAQAIEFGMIDEVAKSSGARAE